MWTSTSCSSTLPIILEIVFLVLRREIHPVSTYSTYWGGRLCDFVGPKQERSIVNVSLCSTESLKTKKEKIEYTQAYRVARWHNLHNCCNIIGIDIKRLLLIIYHRFRVVISRLRGCVARNGIWNLLPAIYTNCRWFSLRTNSSLPLIWTSLPVRISRETFPRLNF